MTQSDGNTALARVVETTALARAEEGIPIEALIARVDKIRQVQAKVMQEGRHYGKIPGVDKPTLLKPGAEMLGMTFQLAPKFTFDERREGDHLEVVVTCTLVHSPTGTVVGDGIGSCSTKESRYAYRKGERTCPECGSPAIIKGKEQFGGGWLCYGKKGGCGAKFADNAPEITSQETGRVANPDIADQYNTVRKMACKRAHVAAILFVTCASEIFTQDVEDGAGGTTSEAGPLLSAIAKAQSKLAINKLVAQHKGRAWSDADRERIREAVAKRRAELTPQEPPSTASAEPAGDDAPESDEHIREPGED